ncbi:hypothetical protein [Streptosporangium sp. NPDC049304]|uniref:hypothetical protein n=1 Tax=Streptosporangium sp. NPDC049304 TaxID=3154830 RepID=UPI003444A9B3
MPPDTPPTTKHDDEQEPPALIAPKRWRCCDCGATGLDSHGITCESCDGLGFC